MNIIIRTLLVATLMMTSTYVEASSDIDQALAKIKRVMLDREARVKEALQAVELSKLDPKEFIIEKLPHESIKLEGEPLKCKKAFFPWLGKQDGYEYEDCVFTVNIKSDADIKGMMLAIANRTIDGWEIDRNELTNQQNLKQMNVVNEEKYRFKRKLK
mgnify:CR=1 FL=1|jgi:hypothetical protein